MHLLRDHRIVYNKRADLRIVEHYKLFEFHEPRKCLDLEPKLAFILESLKLVPGGHVNDQGVVPTVDEAKRFVGVLHRNDQKDTSENLPMSQLEGIHS